MAQFKNLLTAYSLMYNLTTPTAELNKTKR